MSEIETVFDVTGMSCSSCVRHVDGALRKLAGVSAVDVSLEKKSVRVRHDPNAVGAQAMIAAIDEAGYEAQVHGS